jgi:ABC-type multidrug transport system fused ATPase/permease subunit
VKTLGALRERGAKLYGRLRRQGRDYRRNLVWLVGDSLRRQTGHWWRILLASGVTLAGNAAAVGIVYLYVHMLQHDMSMSFAGITIQARDSLLLLGLVIAGLLTALLAFSISTYLSRSITLKLVRRYEEYVFKRVLHLYRLLPDPRAAVADEILRTSNIRQLAIAHARNCGWSLRFIANGIPAGLMFAGALATLLILDPVLTMVVLVLGIGAVAAQYPANLFAARASNTVDENHPRVMAAFNQLVEQINCTPETGRPEMPDELDARIERFYDEPRARRYMDANEDRYRAMELSGLTMQVGGALVLAAILLAIAESLLRQGGDWAVLVAYLGALRLLLSNATQLFRTVSVFSRFYPYTKALQDFLTSAERASLPPPLPSERQVATELVLDARRYENQGTSLQLRGGEPIAVWVTRGYGKDLARSLLHALHPHPEGAEPPRCELVVRAPSGDEIASWTTGEDSGRARWIERVRASGELEAGLEQAAAGRTVLLLIDRVALEALPAERWEYWCRRLADRILLVVYADPAFRPVDHGERVLLVRTRGGALYWDLVPETGLSADQASKLRPLLSQKQGPARLGGDDLLDE